MTIANTITVRRASADDAPAYVRTMGEAEVFPQLMQLPHPGESFWRKRLEDAQAPGSLDLMLVAEIAGKVVGSAGLHPAPQVRRRHAAMLGISVMAQVQRRGVGRLLMQSLCDYADDWAQLLRIELTVFTDNAPAIALYKAFGFVTEGTLRGFAMRHGVYADALTMARLHPKQPLLAWPAT